MVYDKCHGVPRSIRDFPFVVSQNTPEGDDWVEDEGGTNMVNFMLILVRLIHFIEP